MQFLCIAILSTYGTVYNFNLFKYYCPYYNIAPEPHCWSKVLDTVRDLLDIVRVY